MISPRPSAGERAWAPSEPGTDCLLETACARAVGLPVRSRDFDLLARFRSGWVSQLPEGPEVLAEQAKQDLRLVAAIRASRPAFAAVVWAYVHDRMREASALVLDWSFEEAHQLLAEVRMTLAAALLEEDAEAHLPDADRAQYAPPEPALRFRSHLARPRPRQRLADASPPQSPPETAPPKGASR